MSAPIREISIEKARALHDRGEAVFLDVRDPGSFAQAHIPGAVALSDGTIAKFLEETSRQQQLVVYCYHGNSSRGAAGFLQQQGFEKVFSMTGGFEAWRWNNPVEPSKKA